jgi:hypothetical protein
MWRLCPILKHNALLGVSCHCDAFDRRVFARLRVVSVVRIVNRGVDLFHTRAYRDISKTYEYKRVVQPRLPRRSRHDEAQEKWLSCFLVTLNILS